MAIFMQLAPSLRSSLCKGADDST